MKQADTVKQVELSRYIALAREAYQSRMPNNFAADDKAGMTGRSVTLYRDKLGQSVVASVRLGVQVTCLVWPDGSTDFQVCGSDRAQGERKIRGTRAYRYDVWTRQSTAAGVGWMWSHGDRS